MSPVFITDDNENVIPEAPVKEYSGQTGRLARERMYDHNTSFSDPKRVLERKDKVTGEIVKVTIDQQIEEKRSKSELANYIWSLKKQGKKWKIEWSIHRQAINYRNGHRYCDLCLTEASSIAIGDPERMLNRRTEIYRKCPYMPRFKLSDKFFQRKPP